MLRFFYTIICIILISLSCQSKDCSITFSLDNYNRSNIILFGYYGNIYLVDTIKLTDKGFACYKKDLESGVYSLFFPDSLFYDFVYIKGSEIELRQSQNNTTIIASGHIETESFCSVTNQLNELYQNKEIIERNIKSDLLQDSQKELLKIQSKVLSDSIKRIKENVSNNTSGYLISKVIKVNQPVDMSKFKPDKTLSDSAKWIQSLNYFRDHFLDNIDFNDNRLIRTEVLERKLNDFFSYKIKQNSESIIQSVDKLYYRVKHNEEMKQYILGYLLKKYTLKRNSSEIDKVFLHICNTYVFSGIYALPETELEVLKKEADKLAIVQTGNVAPMLELFTLQNNTELLNSFNSKYVVLYFYDAECPVCDRTLYEVRKALNTYSYLDIKAALIYTGDDTEKWTKYISDHKLKKSFLNYSCLDEPMRIAAFKIDFVPAIFLLDENNTILAKNITASKLNDILLSLAVK